MLAAAWSQQLLLLLLLPLWGLSAPPFGLKAQLRDAAGQSEQATDVAPDPGAKYLFYDILEHEQLNKQRKGMMYAYTVAKSLGRRLVLHRLRVRKIQGRPTVGRYQAHYTHEFYPWRKFFNMSHMQGDVPVHEFDQLLLNLSGGENVGFEFYFENVFYLVKLLEGVDRANPRMVDAPCPAAGQLGTTPYQWTQMQGSSDVTPWMGQMYDISGLRAQSVRCVEVYGSLLDVLKPFAGSRSIVLLNAHFQLGFQYTENSRLQYSYYWGVREHLVFKSSLWGKAQRFIDTALGGSRAYLAVHWRRGDFVFARQKSVVKEAAEVAPKITALLKSYRLDTVFLATGPDTTKGDLSALEHALKLGNGALVRFSSPLKKNGNPKLSPATVAIVDQMLCAMGQVFIGTKTSLFTATIMEEREMLGQPFASTNHMFGDDEN